MGYPLGDEKCLCSREKGDNRQCPVHDRKDELLKLIADELIVLDQSHERHILAQQRIAAWRAEYDGQRQASVSSTDRPCPCGCGKIQMGCHVLPSQT